MAKIRISAAEKELLKKMKVEMINSNKGIQINYKREYWCTIAKKVKSADSSVSVTLETSPTGNCQLASIKSFYNVLHWFRPFGECRTFAYDEKTTSKEYKLMMKYRKIEHRIRQLACLKAFYHLRKRITSKGQYFIDIPFAYIKDYHVFHPNICTRRRPEREVQYRSTNGSRMMYSVIEIDKKKLETFE